jgi:hypothetical protein
MLFSENLVKLGDRDPIEEEVDKSPIALVADFEKESRKIQLGTSIDQTSGVNPDEHAEAIQISEKVGLPADSVRQDLPAQRERVKAESINYSDLLKNNPKLSNSLSNPDFSKIAIDDIDNLKNIDDGISGISNIVRGIGERATELAGNLAGFAATTGQNLEADYPIGGLVWAEGEIIPEYKSGEEYEQWQEDRNAATSNILRAGQEVLTEIDLGYVPRETWENVKGSTGAWDLAKNVAGFAMEQGLVSVPDMVAMVATLPSYLASRSEEIATERAHNSGRLTPSPEDMAFGASASVAVTALDRLGLDKMLAPLKGGGGVMGKVVTGTLTEAATEGVQEGIEYIAETAGTKKPFNTDEMLDRMAAGAVGGGGFGAALTSVSAAGAKVIEIKAKRDAAAIEKAEKTKESAETIGDSIKASKLRERSPEKFKEYIETVTKDGDVENVYIPVEKFDEYFQQEDIEFDQLLDEMPAIGEQIEQARERGGDIVIPIADYASIIAPTEHHEGLINDIKFNSTDLTPREAAEMQENMGEVMQEYMEIERERVDNQAEEQSAFDNINESLSSHLKEQGESSAIAEKEAALVAHFFTTMEKYGVNAVEEFEKRGIEVKFPQPEAATKADDLDVFIDRVRLARQPKQAELYGKSMMQALADKGGVQDVGGELSAKDAQLWHRKHYNKKFVQETGMDLDTARETAIQEGYLPENADINDFLEAVDKEIFGEPTFVEGAQDQAAIDRLSEEQELIDYLDRKGINLATATNEEVKAALEGVEAVTEEGVTYDQVSDYTVEVEAIEDETGREVTIQENANVALQEVDNSIATLKELVTCVGG